MSNKSEYVKKWRKNTKKRIIDSMGGKCQICGYNKCNSSLALHHINPDEKEMSFGKMRANPKSWEKTVVELKKCILLCHNCHSEIHDGMTKLPEIYCKFDESFTEYKQEKVLEQNECPVCKKMKFVTNIFCSKVCSGKASRKVDWDNVDLKSLKETMTNISIAEKFGVSEAAIRKRLKKLDLK